MQKVVEPFEIFFWVLKWLFLLKLTCPGGGFVGLCQTKQFWDCGLEYPNNLQGYIKISKFSSPNKEASLG
jgi:hypothetical protein